MTHMSNARLKLETCSRTRHFRVARQERFTRTMKSRSRDRPRLFDGSEIGSYFLQQCHLALLTACSDELVFADEFEMPDGASPDDRRSSSRRQFVNGERRLRLCDSSVGREAAVIRCRCSGPSGPELRVAKRRVRRFRIAVEMSLD